MSDDFSLGSVDVALTPRARFEEYLQSKGKRVTQQRLFLVEFVFRQHDHFDVDELLARLAAEKGMKIGRATVYRSLNELVDAGLLLRHELDGRAVFEHDYGYPEHDHLHCETCGKLIEFQSDALKRLRDEVAREHRFRPTGHRFLIVGQCADCSTNQHRRKSPLDLI